MDTVDILDVEICAPGTWNGVPLSRATFEGIVQAYAETADLVPPRNQLGHDAKQRMAKLLFADDVEGLDGFPNLGRPEKPRINKDGRLVADLMGVPAKAAEWVKKGVYPGRSMGLRHNVKVGDKVYEWLLDHVAILGDQRPAVDGLAPPVILSALEDGALVVFSAGVDASGAPIELAAPQMDEAQIDRALTTIAEKLAALQAEANALTRGLPGNPVLSNLFRALREGIDRVVRTNLAGDEPMPPTPSPDGAPAPEATPALTISSPEVLAAMLAAKVGKGPEDYTAIYQTCIAAIDAAQPADPAADPAAPEGDANMSASDTTNFAAQLEGLKAELAATKAEQAKLLILAAQNDDATKRMVAEARVDRDIDANALPATVRPLLVDLALAANEEHYAAVIATSQKVPTGERGTSDGATTDFAALTLDENEKKAARLVGLSEADFLIQKARDLGIAVPASAAA